MLKALIFDFDGLILDTETPLVDAYGDVHAEHGIPFDRDLFVRQIGHADYKFDPWRAFGPGVDSVSMELRRKVFNRERLERQQVLPGVRALILAAKADSLKLGVASNSSHEWVEPHLKRLGLHGFFDFFGCKGDTPAPKPEPDIYRHVVNQLGLRSCEAVALEDSQTGVTAARRAGLWVVAVPNVSTGDHDFDKAHLQVKSMEELSLPLLREKFFR